MYSFNEFFQLVEFAMQYAIKFKPLIKIVFCVYNRIHVIEVLYVSFGSYVKRKT